jgi:hypothetical protein
MRYKGLAKGDMAAAFVEQGERNRKISKRR